MKDWVAMSDVDRKQKEQEGMAAWHAWMDQYKDKIIDGSPLSKTTRVDMQGTSEVRNEMGAWTLVHADSREEAAQMFLSHPHFMIFPGDRVEVMECLPIPQAQ